jgi:cysteinyl-tRNA synthetase
MNKDHLRKNLVALFKMFKDKPESLAKYFSEYNALNDEFKDRIINNDKLTEFSNENPETPYFTNVQEMKEYYQQFFMKETEQKTGSESLVLKVGNDIESLTTQLDAAISDENYELADRIHNYMKKLNIKYQPKSSK